MYSSRLRIQWTINLSLEYKQLVREVYNNGSAILGSLIETYIRFFKKILIYHSASKVSFCLYIKKIKE